MSDWLAATVQELKRALGEVEASRSKISGDPTPEQLGAVWDAYLHVEKAVALVKLELGTESPGRFVNMKPYVVPDERQALGFSAKWLSEGLNALQSRDLAASLRYLRESRNYLRVLLRQSMRRKSRAASKRT